ncbi:MAG: IS701 family transposase [Polyangiaceae bacterium]|nr:IS701 family transposase [Polyangiaceae bacterium]
MAYILDEAGQGRLLSYFDGIGKLLGRSERREAFAIYALGLLGEGERKSMEPMAARACGDPKRCRAVQEKLLNFVTDSPWRNAPVREYSSRYAIEAMTAEQPIEAWIVDDTGFPKQGKSSPGVQRQYSGTLGKIANCQVAPSLTICTRTQELPIDMDLYLPESWAHDRARCRAAHIPDELEYREKWKIALDLIKRNVAAGVPKGLLLADSAYGDTGEFRQQVHALGFQYALDVKVRTHVQIVGSDGSVSMPMSVGEAAEVIGTSMFRSVTWREGTQHPLSSYFAAIRVLPAHGSTQEQWLVIERPSNDHPATHFVLSTLPKTLSHEQLVAQIKQRWRIERSYQDLKGELGIDHFEGRSYRGWQHHITCALACYAFVVAERSRAFPPSARSSQEPDSLPCAA